MFEEMTMEEILEWSYDLVDDETERWEDYESSF